ncbi:unnamed protein product [Linum tenue]|uniref:Secreted protein n=1 Tax=Linum tenue TaxID=586396 RepID=A0AAV0H8U3_9ROSI|nr:unnamed protein product [Linum tenue]
MLSASICMLFLHLALLPLKLLLDLINRHQREVTNQRVTLLAQALHSLVILLRPLCCSRQSGLRNRVDRWIPVEYAVHLHRVAHHNVLGLRHCVTEGGFGTFGSALIHKFLSLLGCRVEQGLGLANYLLCYWWCVLVELGGSLVYLLNQTKPNSINLHSQLGIFANEVHDLLKIPSNMKMNASRCQMQHSQIKLD